MHEITFWGTSPHSDIRLNAKILFYAMPQYPTKSQIDVGSAVSVETKEKQGSGILVDGIVSEILTHAESHPHGIKVRLQDGQIGRIKKMAGTV